MTTTQHSLVVQRIASVADQAGFTLLEVVVALIIAALAIGVLFHAALTGLHSTAIAAHYEQALSRARSRLAIVEHGSPLAAGDWQGDDGGGFHWHLRVAPIANTTMRLSDVAMATGPSTVQLGLFGIAVWISWQDSGIARVVRLDTEQIGQTVR